MALITTENVFSSDDPFELFRIWKKEAALTEINDPDAIALATVDNDGLPNVRMVLLRLYLRFLPVQ